MANIFSNARRCVWDAIDNWPALSGKFKAKLRYERPQLEGTPRQAKPFRELPSSVTECPAIAIFPASYVSRSARDDNQIKRMPYTLAVMIWTPDLYVDAVEDLWVEVMNACWRNKPPGAGVAETYIKSANGSVTYPSFEPSRLAIARLGNQSTPDDNRSPVLQLTAGITLTLNYQPLANS